MAITGRKTYLKLDGTDVSTYHDGVSGSNNTEELDGTTFQPDVAIPLKNILYGFNDKRLALSGKWTPAVETFFNGSSGIDGAQDVEYVYGPQGHETGQTRIHGKCNVGKYSGPVSTVSGVTTFTAEVAKTSEIVDTFDGGSPS
jgi:hypothetical protein